MHVSMPALTAVTCLGLTLSACTSDTDSQPNEQRPHTVQAYAGRLPNQCDDLISPITVAQLLDRADPGQRTYTYDAPGSEPGLLRGMTCKHGVRPDGTTLSVSAQEFRTHSAAGRQYVNRRSRLAGASDVRVSRRPGVLSMSASSSSLVVLDGAVTVEVGLGTPATRQGPRRTLLSCATKVLGGLDDGR